MYRASILHVSNMYPISHSRDAICDLFLAASWLQRRSYFEIFNDVHIGNYEYPFHSEET